MVFLPIFPVPQHTRTFVTAGTCAASHDRKMPVAVQADAQLPLSQIVETQFVVERIDNTLPLDLWQFDRLPTIGGDERKRKAI